MACYGTSDRDGEAPLDVLELGVALIATRPLLEKKLVSLTNDPDCSRRLLHATLRGAWRARDKLVQKPDLQEALVCILRRQVLD